MSPNHIYLGLILDGKCDHKWSWSKQTHPRLWSTGRTSPHWRSAGLLVLGWSRRRRGNQCPCARTGARSTSLQDQSIEWIDFNVLSRLLTRTEYRIANVKSIFAHLIGWWVRMPYRPGWSRWLWWTAGHRRSSPHQEICRRAPTSTGCVSAPHSPSACK